MMALNNFVIIWIGIFICVFHERIIENLFKFYRCMVGFKDQTIEKFKPEPKLPLGEKIRALGANQSLIESIFGSINIASANGGHCDRLIQIEARVDELLAQQKQKQKVDW